MRRAIYAGSFDPITKGHLDIVRQALAVFDEVLIAIGVNPKKTRLFDTDESVALIRQALSECFTPEEIKRIKVSTFDGTLALAARGMNCSIVRGLRQISDFDDEFKLNGVNAMIASEVPMVYFICRTEFLHVASSTVKEMAALGLNVDWLVTSNVAAAVKEKFDDGTGKKRWQAA